MWTSILLDVDGTLWDTTGLVAVAWNDAVRAEGFPSGEILPSTLRGLFGKPMDEIARTLFPNADKAALDRLMARCCEYEDAILLKNQEDLCYPGVRETIPPLSRQKKLFIVSNCQCGYIEMFLRKTGLADCITDFECFGQTGKGKSENIRLVVERNHLEAPVYVGDTEGDHQAALEAGVPFVHAAYGFGTVSGCDRVIHAFSELLAL